MSLSLSLANSIRKSSVNAIARAKKVRSTWTMPRWAIWARQTHPARMCARRLLVAANHTCLPNGRSYSTRMRRNASALSSNIRPRTRFGYGTSRLSWLQRMCHLHSICWIGTRCWARQRQTHYFMPIKRAIAVNKGMESHQVPHQVHKSPTACVSVTACSIWPLQRLSRSSNRQNLATQKVPSRWILR